MSCDSGDYYVDDIEITNEPKTDGMTAIKLKEGYGGEGGDVTIFSSGLSKMMWI